LIQIFPWQLTFRSPVLTPSAIHSAGDRLTFTLQFLLDTTHATAPEFLCPKALFSEIQKKKPTQANTSGVQLRRLTH
jgi:hypothetical protein